LATNPTTGQLQTRVLVYNCLHNISPSYLSSMCQPVSVNPSRRCLRSAARGDLVVPATKQSATALIASLSQDQLRGTRCLHQSAMTNFLSLHFAVYSRLNFFTRAYDSSLARASLLLTVRMGEHNKLLLLLPLLLPRYSIKCFFQIYKSKLELLSFTPIFILHLPYCKDCISSSFPWHKSKLHSINLYFLSDPSFQHTFYHFHCTVQ